MRIHKEGTLTIIICGILLLLINIAFYELLEVPAVFFILIGAVSAAFFLFIVSFFRNPMRTTVLKSGEVLSPCDGKVVAIEETVESEYFHSKRIQVSIFMSPKNVHVNYYPLNGEVKYVRYHAGKHLVAFSPKSSTDNERSTIVIRSGHNEILVRQIAGMVARRIVTYAKPDKKVEAGDQLGFIKFGSRVDVFFPVNSEISVKLNEVVTGAESVLGKFPL